MIFLALKTKPFGSQTTELYPLELDGSDWQYLQLNGEPLIWASDLESLKNFVENCLQQQGKWTSPGGNNKQFKSCNDKLVITWYFKKQLTLVFQGQDGPFLKEKLFKLVQDKPEMTTDSPNRPTSQNENQQTTDNGADSGSENSLFAELRDIKYSLTVLKKQVDDNTSSLSRYPQNQENIGNEELMKQKGRCEKLQAVLCNKDKEINALKMKIMSLETRASSAEKENDSLKLALKLIRQDMSIGERQQQRNQSYEVTAPQGNSKSDNAQSNESSNPENEWQTVDAKKRKKKNKTRRKKINEAQSSTHDDTEKTWQTIN